ncbi:helix-turn-helix domain-containing protein [Verrucomicrobiota bacterium]
MRLPRTRNPNLAAAMARAGLTGRLLARQCGIHPMTVSGLLNRRRDPKPQTARTIAEALNVSVEELFAGGGGR